MVRVEGPEAIDIDGADDWALCEWHLGRRNILFVVTGNETVGLGHAHNALAVADALTRHRIRFLVDRDSQLALSAIAKRNYDVMIQTRERLEESRHLAPDLVVNDVLERASRTLRPSNETADSW